MKRSTSGLFFAAAMLGLPAGHGCLAGGNSLPPVDNMSIGERSATTAREQGPNATYVSENGEALAACFDNEAHTVTVKLPGGRIVELPLALSASGARYSDERETFWEHQGEASYWIGDRLVFKGKKKLVE